MLSRYYFLLIIVFIFSCQSNQEETPVIQEDYFSGTITYSVEIGSNDSALSRRFFDYVPQNTTLLFGDGFLRIIEEGGASKANVIINMNDQTAWQIVDAERTVYQGDLANLDDAPESVKSTLPDYYSPTLSPTGAKSTILGYECSEYLVERSGFVPAGVPASVWIAKSVSLPSCRFDIETDFNTVSMPLPIQLGVREGTVFRLDYIQGDQQIVCQITSIDTTKVDDSHFKLPKDYRFN